MGLLLKLGLSLNGIRKKALRILGFLIDDSGNYIVDDNGKKIKGDL